MFSEYCEDMFMIKMQFGKDFEHCVFSPKSQLFIAGTMFQFKCFWGKIFCVWSGGNQCAIAKLCSHTVNICYLGK